MTGASPTLTLKDLKISECRSELDLRRFCCGDRDLDEWAAKFALQHHRKNFVRLFCAHGNSSNRVVGFYSLALNVESVEKLTNDEKKSLTQNNTKNFPAIFIRSLAVDRKHQGKKLGTFLLMDALKRCYFVSKNVAVFGVALTSKNERTTKFYKNFGFGVRDEGHNPTMILPIWSLWDLIDGPVPRP